MSESKMKKILITGAAGNIGSALTLALCKKREYLVLAVDDLSTGSIEKLPSTETENYRFIKADVNDCSEMSAIFLNYHYDFDFQMRRLQKFKPGSKDHFLFLA